MRLSLIATTYNQPADLDLYLRCLRKQTLQDFQIVIADDGSTAETCLVIEHHQREWAHDRLVHVWHEDTGYRKAKIVNEAVRRSKGEWLVFTDSDHLVNEYFVQDHAAQQSARTLFMGRRVDLSPRVSEWARKNPQKLFGIEFHLRVLLSAWSAQPTRNAQRSLRVGSKKLAQALKLDHVPDLLGSNFSIDRALLYEVNGFNENSEHYWGEDCDLFARIVHVGATLAGRKNFAVQLHLWHPLRRPKPDAERAYLALLNDTQYRRCEQGLQSFRR
jgi:glycosyltransferase involved in cell wall biosynthesis